MSLPKPYYNDGKAIGIEIAAKRLSQEVMAL